MREYSKHYFHSPTFLFLIWKNTYAYLVENIILEMDSLSSVSSGLQMPQKISWGLVFPLFDGFNVVTFQLETIILLV
jgi:hypothetical protein